MFHVFLLDVRFLFFLKIFFLLIIGNRNAFCNLVHNKVWSLTEQRIPNILLAKHVVGVSLPDHSL